MLNVEHTRRPDPGKTLERARTVLATDPGLFLILLGKSAEQYLRSLVAHPGTAPREAASREWPTSLSEMLDVLERRQLASHDDLWHLRNLAQMRNVAAHALNAPLKLSVDEAKAMLAAVEALRSPATRQGRASVPAPPSISQPLPRKTSLGDPASAESERTAETPAEAVERSNSNVDQLRRLLATQLPPNELKALIKEARTRGIEGADEGVLCEMCLTEDPVKLLTDNFTRIRLAEVADSLGVAPDARGSKDQLAMALLGALGFSTPTAAPGLGAALKRLTQLRATLQVATERDAIIGVVGPATAELERILHGLIVFYATVFWGRDYRSTISGWSKDYSGRLTLGARCNILLKLEKEVDRGERLRTKRDELFGGRGFVVGRPALRDLVSVAPERGKLIHFHDDVAALTTVEAKARVAALLQKEIDFLEHLHAQRLYPRVVTVREQVIDGYGRSFVRFLDEEGQVEKVYTETDVRPGRSYFMHPVTIPVRIYPHLVEYIEAD